MVMMCACVAEDDLILASSIPPGKRNDDICRHFLSIPQMEYGFEAGDSVVSESFSDPGGQMTVLTTADWW